MNRADSLRVFCIGCMRGGAASRPPAPLTTSAACCRRRRRGALEGLNRRASRSLGRLVVVGGHKGHLGDCGIVQLAAHIHLKLCAGLGKGLVHIPAGRGNREQGQQPEGDGDGGWVGQWIGTARETRWLRLAVRAAAVLHVACCTLLWFAFHSHSHSQPASSPHGDVLLEAGAEGSAGDLPNLLAVSRQHLQRRAGGGDAHVRQKACTRLHSIQAGVKAREAAQLHCWMGRQVTKSAARSPPTSECCRAGAPLLMKPTRRVVTPSASCCLMTCRQGKGGQRGSQGPVCQAGQLQRPGMPGAARPPAPGPAHPTSTHLAAQEIEGLAPPLAHGPGQARLNGSDVLIQVVACKLNKVGRGRGHVSTLEEKSKGQKRAGPGTNPHSGHLRRPPSPTPPPRCRTTPHPTR